MKKFLNLQQQSEAFIYIKEIGDQKERKGRHERDNALDIFAITT